MAVETPGGSDQEMALAIVILFHLRLVIGSPTLRFSTWSIRNLSEA